MFEKIKKCKGRLIVLVIFLIVGIPLLIHTAYKIDFGVSFFMAEWSAGEFLQYYAAVLTFVSTTFLSVIALQYTIIFKKDDDKTRNKVTAYLMRSSAVEVKCYSDAECTIELMFDNLCENFPEFAIVKRTEVYRSIPSEKISIPCYRKAFCTVHNQNRKSFSIQIHFIESPVELTNIVNNKKILKDYKRGLITKDEMLKESKQTIVIEFGVYREDVVTPFFAYLHLGLENKGTDESLNKFNYIILDANLHIGSAVLAMDYERNILE